MRPSLRPPVAERSFRSRAVDDFIETTRARITDPQLGWLFGNCHPNTLDTTVWHECGDDGPDTFVITGDIHAMWLRDSTAQVWPYLRHAREDAALQRMLCGLVRRQARCILIDPCANAFNREPVPSPEWSGDHTVMLPGVFERKYEPDSLCAFLRLSHGYHAATGNTGCFDGKWLAAFDRVLETLREGQRGTVPGVPPAYRFERTTARAIDSLPIRGTGYPARACGLTRTPFRPSDDAAVFPYLIPANAMAVVCLRRMADLLGDVLGEEDRARAARALADGIDEAIRACGVIHHPHAGRVFAYEVDGYGSALFMDDANLPSLLSLPYLGYVAADDPVYRATRAAVLSETNPFFFKGSALEGVGGPHAGIGFVWPMSLCMRILTSTEAAEVERCLLMLQSTHADTGFMHEAIWMDDPARFTRPWFAWANSLFGETIVHVLERWPGLID